MAPSPTLQCPTTPTCPVRIALLPISVDPASPTCAQRSTSSPTWDPCPTCTRLSTFTPRPIRVSPTLARSMQEFACTSTSSSITTGAGCGILCQRPSAIFAHVRPVSHLHEVVDLHPASDTGFPHAGAIDARIRLHFHIVLNHHRRGLRNLVPATFCRLRKPKPIRANDDAVLQKHIVADAAILAHHRMRMREEVVPDLHPAINNDMRQQHRVRADLNVLADHHIRPDVRICSDARAGVNDRGGMHSSRSEERRVGKEWRSRWSPY